MVVVKRINNFLVSERKPYDIFMHMESFPESGSQWEPFV